MKQSVYYTQLKTVNINNTTKGICKVFKNILL